MNDGCPSGYVRIPSYCRKKNRSPTRRRHNNTDKEIQLLQTAIAKTETHLKPKESSVRTIQDLGYTSAEQIVNEDPRVALSAVLGYYNQFYQMANTIPFFFSFAHERMISPRYKKRFPNPNQRYEYIKDRFSLKKIEIPIAYKLAVLKATLATATTTAATTSVVTP
jgi:hypothetical protein